MTIREESQLLEPGSKIELFELDATGIDVAAGYLRFHNMPHTGPIVWKGVSYDAWPIEVKGFSRTPDRPANPTISAANLNGALTAMCLLYDDLVGAVFTRRRTLSKYLDAVNFPGNVNPTANPAEAYTDEIWFVDRKEAETHEYIKWSLSSALDFNGVALPRRMIVANQCTFKYRGEGCMYSGGPVAKIDDTATADPNLDRCSHKVSGCKLRFGANNKLYYGGFPAAGLMRS